VALAVGTGGVEWALLALTYTVEHHPNSNHSAGIGVQYPAGDVKDLSGERSRKKDGEDEEYLLRRSTTD
jgi:hypothetical protein